MKMGVHRQRSQTRRRMQALWNFAFASMSMDVIAYICSLNNIVSACRPWTSGLLSTQRISSCISLLARNWPATVPAIFAITLLTSGQSVEGTWDATVTVNTLWVRSLLRC
jgi:hypothetical protein